MATYAVGFKNFETGKTAIATKGLTKDEALQMKECMKAVETEFVKVVVKIEMNSHEKQVDLLIQEAVSEYIGAYENTLSDFPEDSEEYKEAKELLNHDTLFEIIYDQVMKESASNYASHIRFAGKAFIEDRIEKRLKKEGYGK